MLFSSMAEPHSARIDRPPAERPGEAWMILRGLFVTPELPHQFQLAEGLTQLSRLALNGSAGLWLLFASA
jgi:hypothetical protein